MISTKFTIRFYRLAGFSLLMLTLFSCSRRFVPASGPNAPIVLQGEISQKGSIGYTDPSELQDTIIKPDSIQEVHVLASPDSVTVLAEPDSTEEKDKTISSEPVFSETELDTVCIIGTGDIMPGTNYPDARYLPPGGCAALFDPVRHILGSADLTFGNLEGVFCSEGGRAKKCRDPNTCYVFRMPDEYLECILDAGYDVLSVANNHVNDFGYAGRVSTAKMLDQSGVPYAGFIDKASTTFEKGGILYGFAAFSPHTGTASLKDYEGAARIVAALDSVCDIVIVSFHGGAEGRDHQHIPCTDEVYLGYNRGNACKFAHAVVDAGADVVFGHGPHVARAMELYKHRLICYSLGNFCTYARFNLSGPNGIAPVVKVFLDLKGNFLEGEIIPVYQAGAGGPRPDPQGRVIEKIRELTTADFPGGMLRITDEGRIYPFKEEIIADDTLRDSLELINRTFLGNWERNYYGQDAPSNLELVWKHYLGKGITVIGRKTGSREWEGAGWTGQPLMVREGRDTFLIQGAYDHHLKKINASTGELVWQYKFDDVIKGSGTIWFNASDTSPEKRWIILQGSRLGAMEDHFLDAPKVYSYRAISYMTGKELWRHNSKLTQSYSRDVDASALIHNDTAYIGLENSYFTVFNPDPDSAYSSGEYKHPLIYRQQLMYTQKDVSDHSWNVVTEASPCRIGRMIYVSSGAGHVWGYNMDSQELTWDFYTGSDMDGSPVVTDDSCLIVTIEKQYIDGRGGILKLDPSRAPENAVVWYYPVPDKEYASWSGGVIGSAAVTDSYNDMHLAAAVSIDGMLSVLRHDSIAAEKVVGFDGKTSYPAPLCVFTYPMGPSISTPLFTKDRLVACSYDGIYLFSYDNEGNFELLDKKAVPVESTPFIYNKKIYIASRDGYLYCLGTKD